MRRLAVPCLIAFAFLFVYPLPASAILYTARCGKTTDADCDDPEQVAEKVITCEGEDAVTAYHGTCKAICGGMAVCNITKKGEIDDSDDGAPKEYKLVNPLGTASIPQLIGNVLNIFLSVVGTAAFLMFVYGGFLWLISGGSADRIKQGKNTMVWAALGLVLVFSSAALVRFVLQAFGAGT